MPIKGLGELLPLPFMERCCPWRGRRRPVATVRDAPRHVHRLHVSQRTRGYNFGMDIETIAAPMRRPRFRRASEPPAFRLTEDDIVIVRQLARHRFLRSTHIAALIGRSLD